MECLERSAFLALLAESRVVVCLPPCAGGLPPPRARSHGLGRPRGHPRLHRQPRLPPARRQLPGRGAHLRVPLLNAVRSVLALPASAHPEDGHRPFPRRRTRALSCAPRGNRSPLAHGMSKSRTGCEVYRNGAMRELSPWRPSPLRPGPGKRRHGTTDSRNTPPPRRQSVRKGGATPALSRRCPGDVGSEGRPPTLPPPYCAARSRNKTRKERIPSARSIARSAPRQPSMPFRQPWGTADEAQHGVSVFASIRKRLVTGQLVRRGNAKTQDHAVPQYVVPLSCTTGGSVQQVRMKQHPLARSERHRLGELRRHSSGIT